MFNLIPVQYRVLAAFLALLAFGGTMYWWGISNARSACSAANGKANAKVEALEDKRDLKIDTIAQQTADKIAQELAQNRNDGNESAEKIRTVYVRPECRAVDPAILQELRQARDYANAAKRTGL